MFLFLTSFVEMVTLNLLHITLGVLREPLMMQAWQMRRIQELRALQNTAFAQLDAVCMAIRLSLANSPEDVPAQMRALVVILSKLVTLSMLDALTSTRVLIPRAVLLHWHRWWCLLLRVPAFAI